MWWWRKVRKANIPANERDIFERYGEAVISTILAGSFSVRSQDLVPLYQDQLVMNHARDWLTESSDIHANDIFTGRVIEVFVVLLIGLEIILSVYGLTEGRTQAKILSQMNDSTAATAQAMLSLQKAQSDSLKAQQDMLTTIEQMNGVTQRQFNEEEERLGRKPKIEISVGNLSWKALQTHSVFNLEVRSDGWGTLPFLVLNTGTAAVTKPVVIVVGQPATTILTEPSIRDPLARNVYERAGPNGILDLEPLGLAGEPYAFNIDVKPPEGGMFEIEFKLYGENLSVTSVVFPVRATAAPH